MRMRFAYQPRRQIAFEIAFASLLALAALLITGCGGEASSDATEQENGGASIEDVRGDDAQPDSTGGGSEKKPAEDVTYWLDPHSSAIEAVDSSPQEQAALLSQIAQVPQAVWVGDWIAPNEVSEHVRSKSAQAAERGEVLLLALYAIPARDCGNYSAGGFAEDDYRHWIDQVAHGLAAGGSETWVVLEPDALANLGDCGGQGDRVELLRYGARSLSGAGATVYIDAGHSGWNSAEETASRLSQVGLEHARGFALNVSNYNFSEVEEAYGYEVLAALADHGVRTSPTGFVIDTSRNANGGVQGEWCNVSGQAIGVPSQVVAADGSETAAPQSSSEDGLDAYLWVKRPGESDGECNGGPPAGQWWQEGALELVKNQR